MNLLSIDVGIKNLACCSLCIDNNDYTIKSWDIIDLCETKNEKCLCLNKNGSICNKKGIYHKNERYYCKKHAELSDYLIPCKELTIKKLKKKKIQELKDLCNTFNISIISPALKNNIVLSIENYVNERCLEKVETTNANDMNLITIGRKINELLSKKYENIFDIVLIENQISPIASRMKTVQGMICQYFIMNNVKKIEFVSSINKLKGFDLGKLKSYSERKKKSISITKGLLKGDTSSKIFDKSKKKDDLADCFLQGLWYLKDKNIII
tara:strand:- start:147 stop:950 length:804 start_codon:yes stop_codon:yes gene_type:complete